MGDSVDELLAAARTAAEQAYSPYSKIRVGAALLAEDGRVFHGCNVENASYGLTLCAERAAAVAAVTAGARAFRTIAIWTSLGRSLPPCGACRQFLAEFAPDLRVVVGSDSGDRIDASLRELLPNAMGPSDLD